MARRQCRNHRRDEGHHAHDDHRPEQDRRVIGSHLVKIARNNPTNGVCTATPKRMPIRARRSPLFMTSQNIPDSVAPRLRRAYRPRFAVLKVQCQQKRRVGTLSHATALLITPSLANDYKVGRVSLELVDIGLRGAAKPDAIGVVQDGIGTYVRV